MKIWKSFYNFMKRVRIEQEKLDALREQEEQVIQEEQMLQEKQPPLIQHQKQTDNLTVDFLAYRYGHLLQIYPFPIEICSNYIDLICAADVIQSGRDFYDLTSKDSILSIKVPPYEIHVDNQKDKLLGIYGTLEFKLRNKGDQYWEDGYYELAIACYGKATQCMFVSDAYWEDSDFFLVVEKLREIGKDKQADKWEEWITDNLYDSELDIELGILDTELTKSEIEAIKSKTGELSKWEKEVISTDRITTEDMIQFSDMPYELNCEVNKFIRHGSHPFAYMDLNPFNQNVAKVELSIINRHIIDAMKYIPTLSDKFTINTEKIAFQKYNPSYGYTRLMCEPYTFSGRISKFPLCLNFMSRVDIDSYQVLGELYYTINGIISKASVCIHRRTSYECPADSWMFYFKTIDNQLILYKVLSTDVPDEYGRAGVIYKHPILAEKEQEEAHDRKLFLSLTNTLPHDCPKTFAAFRKMKQSNSKKYIELKKKALQVGIEL